MNPPLMWLKSTLNLLFKNVGRINFDIKLRWIFYCITFKTDVDKHWNINYLPLYFLITFVHFVLKLVIKLFNMKMPTLF